MNFYNVPLTTNFISVLKSLILNKETYNNSNEKFLIITPNKKSLTIFDQNLKNDKKLFKCKYNFVAISETKYLLKELLPFSPNSLHSEIKKLLNTQVITNNARTFLISNLIKKSNFFSTIDNIWPLANQLAHILDVLESENISIEQIKNLFLTDSAFSDSLVNILNTIYPFWKQLLQDLKLINILCYRSKVFNLLAKIIPHINHDSRFNIVSFAIDNYSSSTLKFLYSIANYKLGKVIFNGIDFSIIETEWNQLSRSHPQYITSKILSKLNLKRNNIKSLEELLPLNEITTNLLKKEQFYTQGNNLDVIKTIFNSIPTKISSLTTNNTPPQLNLFSTNNTSPNSTQKLTSCNNISYIELSNEEEEAAIIVKLIEYELKNNTTNTISLVTTNTDLIKRITFNLNALNIDYDNSYGLNLSKTQESIFFILISTIDLDNINFIDLLALLKHPLCCFSINIHYIHLIDLHLSRAIIPGKNIQEYLNLLSNLLKHETITNEEYLGIKEIFNSLQNIFSTWQNLKKTSLNFNETLNIHIEITQQLYINSQEESIWSSSNGTALKTLLNEIIQGTSLLTTLNLQEYNNILILLLKQTTLRSPTNSNIKVYIGGILQAQFLTNSTIIIADMNEGSFPTTQPSETPCTNQIFHKFQLPHSYDNIGKEGFIFQKLCYQPKLYITRSIKKLHTTNTISRFLIKLFNTLEVNKISLNNSFLEKLKTNLTPNFKHTSSEFKNKAKIIEAKVPISYRPNSISATAIEKLLQNPYIYFIEHILNLKPLNHINPPFNNLISGILIHTTIEKFFYKYKEISTPTLTQIEEILINSAYHSFKPYIEKYPSALLSLNIFKYFLPSLAKEIFNLSKSTQFFHNEIWGKIVLELKNKKLTINGRTDCLALTNDGVLIIDFKTGSQSSLQSDLNKHRKQLLVLGYILLNKGFFNKDYPLNNLEYWIIPNTFSNKFNKIPVNKNLEEPLENYINNNLDNIQEILKTFLTTEEPFTFNLKHKNIIKEYQHFIRKEEIFQNH